MQKSQKQKLFVATELFYPEEASTAHYLTQIVIKLSSKYDIEVLAGTPVYKVDEEKLDYLPCNVNVTRLGDKTINKNNIIKRFFRAFSLSFKMKRFIARNSHANDKILMVTNPALLALILPRWCKRHERHITMIVHDVFPENTVAAGLLKSSSAVYKLAKKFFDSSYACVDKFIVCGNDMKEVIMNKLGKQKKEIVVIQNWGDTERIIPLKTRDDLNITIQFAGNIGRVQGFEKVLQIIHKVQNPLVQFVIRGNGALIETLKERANREFKNLTVLGAYSRVEENDVLNSCDLSFVSLNSSMYGLGVPSKSYNCMAAGKPILFLGPKNSEIYTMVNTCKIGYSFDIDDVDSVTYFINGLTIDSKVAFKAMGLEARRCVESIYSKEKLLNMYFENV